LRLRIKYFINKKEKDMTQQELTVMQEEKGKNRFKSRTFWLTVAWFCLVPASFAAQIIIPDFELPISTIVTLAGSISLIYVGGNKAVNAAEVMKLDKK